MLRAHRLVTSVVCFLAACVGLSVAPGAVANPSPSNMLIIISDVIVGQPGFAGDDKCASHTDPGEPLIPVTVVAQFIPPPGKAPDSPYATVSWSGGTGSWEPHPGNKALFQVFHINVKGLRNLWKGSGIYDFKALVQNPRLEVGLTTREVTREVREPRKGVAAKFKCSQQQPFDGVGMGKKLADALLDELKKAAIERTPVVGELITQMQGWYEQAVDVYGATLTAAVDYLTKKDPPDPGFDRLAQPVPALVIAPDSDIDPDLEAAYLALYGQYAVAIGLAEAAITTTNRLWGASNARSQYWYDRQLAHLKTLSTDLAAGIRALTPLWADVRAAFGHEIPEATITREHAREAVAELAQSSPESVAADLAGLGLDDVVVDGYRDFLLQHGNAETFEDVTVDDVDLFADPVTLLAPSVDLLAVAADDALEAEPPVITSVSPNRVPASGGEVRIRGANLADVVNVDFGPSTETAGQGSLVSRCSETECTVRAPRGTGTVDVVPVSPAGPATGKVQLTYEVQRDPVVSHMFPRRGKLAGDTEVVIFGEDLRDAQVRFGVRLVPTWLCRDTICWAKTPPSAAARAVDVTVVTGDGRSSRPAPSARFSYVEGTAPPGPVVTSVAPTTVRPSGGQTVTITGRNLAQLEGATVGPDRSQHWLDAVPVDLQVVNDETVRIVTPPRAQGRSRIGLYGPGGVTSTVLTFEGAGAKPVIDTISPDHGPEIGGTAVTITGDNFTDASVEVLVDERWAEWADADAACTETTCELTMPPASVGAHDVRVVGPDFWDDETQFAATEFTYEDAPAPTVASMTPEVGPTSGGNLAVLFGDNLNSARVTLDGEEDDELNVDDTGCGPTSCVLRMPEHARGPVTLSVATRAGRTTTGYTYLGAGVPVVDGVFPPTGWEKVSSATDLEIVGDNLLGAEVFVGGTQVEGDVECTMRRCSFRTPYDLELGVHEILVRTEGGTSAVTGTTTFTLRRPVITAISPATGTVNGGEQVTITGRDLEGGVVAFGTTDAEERCERPTRCTVTAPPWGSPGTVDITVRNEDEDPDFPSTSERTAASKYTFVNPPAPVVTALSRTSGTNRGGDEVTVTGRNLVGGRVFFGTRQATATCTATECAAVAPYWGSDAVVDVTVVTKGGTSAVRAATSYRYHAPERPVVTAVSPATGSENGSEEVVITGDNLTNARFRFGGSSDRGATCQEQRCVVTTPSRSPGEVTVVATVDSLTSEGGPSFIFVEAPRPVITGLDPARGPASGGDTVTVTGAGLAGATLTLDGVPISGAQCSPTSCTFVQPSASPGRVPVVATNLRGSSAVTAASTFTVLPIRLTEVPGLPGGAAGSTFATGADGDLLTAFDTTGEIARIEPGGVVTRIPLGDPREFAPWGVAAGTDGRLWVTERRHNRVVAVADDGTQTSFDMPGTVDDLGMLTAGPDGRTWFTLYDSAGVGAIDPESGAVDLFPVNPLCTQTNNCWVQSPHRIMPGADGRLWFKNDGYGIGAVTTDGKVSLYELPGGGKPGDIVSGPDGRIWATDWSRNALHAIDTHGVAQTYRMPEQFGGANWGLALGPDGRFWFVSRELAYIHAWNPLAGGEVDHYPLPKGHTQRDRTYLTFDDAGDLWVTAQEGAPLVRVTGIGGDLSPEVVALSQTKAPAGTSLTLTGTQLSSATRVRFGATTAEFTVLDEAHLQVVVPPGTGSVDVRVVTPAGTSAVKPAGRFTYGAVAPPRPTVTEVNPNFGPSNGGTQVVVRGTDLTGGTITIGGAAARNVRCTAVECTATTPVGAAGTADLVVRTSGGTSAPAPFTYFGAPPPAPVVTSLSPARGPVTGGNQVVVTGTNLADGVVTIGLKTATGTCTATRCTVVVPDAGAGAVPVWVTTAGGTSARTAAARYTYLTGDEEEPALSATQPPAITGSPVVGQRLTATPGEWNAAAGFAYRWLRDGTPIAGATASSYVATDDDIGHRLRVEVVASAAGYQDGTARSAQTDSVRGVITAGTVAIKGRPVLGTNLKAVLGGWSKVTLTYQWLRNGKVIKGAKGPKYRLTKADLRKRIVLKVKATRPDHLPVTVKSKPTKKIRR